MMKKRIKTVMSGTLILVVVLLSQAYAMTYFRILVEGVESSTQTQGQMQTLEADCGISGMIDLVYILDSDSSGTIGPTEHQIFMFALVDNATEFPPDTDPTAGTMSFPWPLSFAPGYYVVLAIDEADSIAIPYHVIAPDPIERSVSGYITLEGVEPPDHIYGGLSMMAGTMEPPQLMYFMTDEMGEFQFNWPGEDDTLIIFILGYIEGYSYESSYQVYVDGHVTGFEIFFPIAGLSTFDIYVEGIATNTQVQGEEYAFEIDCEPLGFVNIEVYSDIDSNGVIDGSDFSIFLEPWTVYDNTSDYLIYDSNETEGVIYIQMPFNLPPGYYVIRAHDGTTELNTIFIVRPPTPLTMSISGTVILEGITPPDSRLYRIIVGAEGLFSTEIYLGQCDDYGNFTCNWDGDPGDVILKFYEPYPYGDWDFGGTEVPVYIDGFVTDVEIIVFHVSHGDSILINFSDDPDGLWEVPPSDVQASYFDIDREYIESIVFPDEGDIYIPIREYPCGILFEGTYPEFSEHQFLSPAETVWISPDSFPGMIEVYANQTNYHFMVILDSMELDSVPAEGIVTELFGWDAEGHTYYTQHTLFIDYYGEEDIVGGEHELCDAEWRYVIPGILPHNYVPAFTETTFTIPEVTTWPWFELHVPLTYTGINEGSIPRKFGFNLFPNPFNSKTSIEIYLQKQSHVSIGVYNLKGELVTQLINKPLDKGIHNIGWEGLDQHEVKVAAGIYLFKLQTPAIDRVIKGIYLK